MAPSIQIHQARLESQLETVQTGNSDLLATIMQQRREIDTLVSGLETLVGDLDASLATLPHDEMLALTQETVAMDEEMRVDD